MSAREKQLYAIVLVLAVTLAGTIGYLSALVVLVPPGANSGEYTESSQYELSFPSALVGSEQRTISVAGLGRASAKPNQIELRLGVETQETNATDALEKNAELMDRLIGALKGMGILEEDIETSRFSIHPRYTTYGNKLIGFEVNHMLRVVTTNLDQVGQLIDRAVEAGANRVEGVYFTFTKDILQGLTELARQWAVEDARSRAETIADSLGVEIIGVASADETSYYPSSYYEGISFAVTAPAPAPPTPIMPPTEVEVTVMIRVVFMIE